VATAAELLKQGREREIWTKYCGFLDLTLASFMGIQERLLLEQLSLLARSRSALGTKFVTERSARSIASFREESPITTYEDYEEYLDERRADVLPEEPFIWAHTSGRSGKFKWFPYTRRAFTSLGERVLAGVILGAARWKGDMRLAENDVLVYNTPPRPYFSGITLRALAEQFNFRFVPSLDETEALSFQERIERGFQTGLVTGIDVLGSIAVVLVKMGERFAQGAQTTRLSHQLLHPKALARLVRGWARSRIEGRSLLPRDLWRVKALPSGGMDTSIYRDKIQYYWGVAPNEQYGSTEEGTIATQAWNGRAMTFFPDGAFLEFIPEEEWAKWRLDPSHVPKTVLLDQVETGKRYEVVISSFYGQPLVRYRMFDIIEFVSMQDDETGVRLPQMQFVGRSGDFIDLAGFTGLIDEKLVWTAIVQTEIPFEEWVIRKEMRDGRIGLHLYIEPAGPVDAEKIRTAVNARLEILNPFYADYESLIEGRPLDVTVLNKGTFQEYTEEKARAGADLAHLKPPHMNAGDQDIERLLALSGGRG
jgi:hypothetical protein